MQQTVFLKTPVPVVIVYWTVSVGASGELRFAKDVYNLDRPLLLALAQGGDTQTGHSTLGVPAR